MNIKKTAHIEREIVSVGKNTYRQVLISGDEGPHFAMRKFIIEPGGAMPRHTNTVEHEQYVLAGQATIGIGDETFQVEKDDVVFIPANVPHWYRVIGKDSFEFLCIIPNLPDKTKILSSE